MSKAPRKIRDKWRSKEWYAVYTPSYFGEQNIAEIPCEDPSKVVGRVIESTLYDITGDFAHQSTKLYFLATNVKGNRAETTLKSHEYSTDYLRSLVRRGSSRIDYIAKATTKDNFVARISIVAFARGRVNASQQHSIRAVMSRIIEEKARDLTYDQLSQEMVLGKIGSDIYNEAKKIAPLRHVGVRKSRLMKLSPELEEIVLGAKKS
ncbi:30S ribosomal protein S3ae [Candidatus Bathyarchaeota archaeon]|nr:30S ribosomal protein S3ae [Candidatus Bathyarchaeota archaeon]